MEISTGHTRPQYNAVYIDASVSDVSLSIPLCLTFAQSVGKLPTHVNTIAMPIQQMRSPNLNDSNDLLSIRMLLHLAFLSFYLLRGECDRSLLMTGQH